MNKHNNTDNLNSNNNNGLKDDDPFVVKVSLKPPCAGKTNEKNYLFHQIPISSEIISNGGSSSSEKPSEPSTEKNPSQTITQPATPSTTRSLNII